MHSNKYDLHKDNRVSIWQYNYALFQIISNADSKFMTKEVLAGKHKNSVKQGRNDVLKPEEHMNKSRTNSL